jgi:hypothetical protein
MASKTLLAPLLTAALLLGGCATARKAPAQAAARPIATPKTQAATEDTAQKRKPQTASRPASPRQKPQPVSQAATRSELPGMIGEGATWTSYGFRSLSVTRGGAATRQPVPIFRQAGALAAVRAALADSPAQPQAEFRNGVLTLKFAGGSNEEIASAVNKTLSVTGSRNLQVTLQP